MLGPLHIYTQKLYLQLGVQMKLLDTNNNNVCKKKRTIKPLTFLNKHGMEKLFRAVTS